MRNLLEVLDKISKEVPEETIKKIINLDDFYKLCVDYGYLYTQDVFKVEYKDILEKSINSLTKSELADDELSAVSGGSSSQFKSGVALVLASIGTLSPSIGAMSQKNSSFLSNKSSISEKISGYTKNSKEYISSGLNYLKNGTESLLSKGKEGLNEGLEYASKYGSKLVEYGSDAAKKAGNLIKAHPVESSLIGTSGVGTIGTGAFLINKLSSNSEKVTLPSSKINDKNQKNANSIGNNFTNVVKFIDSISPKSVNGKATCDFIVLKPNKQKELVNLCLKDLGMTRELTLDNLSDGDLIKSCIEALYDRVSVILKNGIENQDKIKELKSIHLRLLKLAELYKIQLENTSGSKSSQQSAMQNQENRVKNTNFKSNKSSSLESNLTTNIVRMELNGGITEIQLEDAKKIGDRFDVSKYLNVSGPVWREIGEDTFIKWENKDKERAKELKEIEDLKAKIRSELIKEETNNAENYIKQNGSQVKKYEEKLSEINNKIANLEQEISKTNVLLENCRNELTTLKKEYMIAEDNYNKAQNIPIVGNDLEKVKLQSYRSRLFATKEDYKKRISDMETEIKKNEEKNTKSEEKRNKLLEEKSKVDPIIGRYYKYIATKASIENGTYKVDEAKVNKEFLERRPTNIGTISASDLFEQVQKNEKRNGGQSTDEVQDVEDDEDEWSE